MISKNRKIVLGALLAVLVFILGFRVAEAQTPKGAGTITDITTIAVYGIVYGLIYLIAKIASIFFSLAGFLIDLALTLNLTLLSSPLIQNGWKIVLGIANLGFVLAIIVIAFATILRIQSYAIKQTLRKLIVAALLVNFSLVIAGAFISAADIITNSLNEKLQGVSLSTRLTDLLKIQSFGDPLGQITGENITIEIGQSIVTAPLRWSAKGFDFLTWITGGQFLAKELGYKPFSLEEYMFGSRSDAGKWLSIIASLFFAVFFIFLSVLTYLAIAVMLFIRYIALGILLILSPIVWLLWIFPATVGEWQKWWRNFLRWVFFAPIAIFFLFVAIYSLNFTQEQLNNLEKQSTAASNLNPIIESMDSQQQGLPITLADIGQKIIVLGLLLGGLIAANSLGITGSKFAMSLAQKTGRRFGAWSGRWGARGGLWAATRLGGLRKEENWATRLQKRAEEWKGVGGWFGKQTLGRLAQAGALVAATGRERQAERYEKLHEKQTIGELKAALLTAFGAERVGILNLLAKKEGGAGLTHDYLAEKYAKEFSKFGQKEEHGNIEKKMLMSSKAYELFKQANTENDKNKQAQLLGQANKELEDLYKKMSKKDWSGALYNKVYGDKPPPGLEQIRSEVLKGTGRGILAARPESLGIMMANIKGENLGRVRESFEENLNQNISEALKGVDVTAAIEIDKQKVNLANLRDKIFQTKKPRELALNAFELRAFEKWAEVNNPTAFRQTRNYRRSMAQQMWESFIAAAGGAPAAGTTTS
jgi:hypothetical protein